MLAFAHIPTGPNTTGGFNDDVIEVNIGLTNTVPTMATIEDEIQPGALLLAGP